MKRLFILATLSLIFISNIIYSQTVDIKTSYPPNAQQGQEFEIKITINKGDVSGFARLQLDFPEGFTVKSTQLQGATFTFKDNKARFLWMALPADKEMSVNCRATASASNSGNQDFEGAFSYVLNNETQKVLIPKNTIIVNGGAGLVVKNEVKNENTDVSNNVIKNENGSSQDAEKLEAERKARELAIAKAEKEKNDREEQEKRIKEEAAQKAKEEALANGKAENKNEEVVVNNNENQEKIDQEKKAKEEALLIAEEERLAKIKENEDQEKLEQEKNAKEDTLAFSEKEKQAREAEEAKLAQLQKEEVKVVEENNKNSENNQVNESNELELKAKEEANAKFEEERLAKEKADKLERERAESDRLEKEKLANEMALKPKYTEKKEINSNINNATINNNIDFRVQVGASKQVADQGYYNKLNKNISEFKVLQNNGDDGWFRYTIGSFSEISSAQNFLPKVKQLGFEGFVVAFKDGKKITIQEAKKILGQ